MYCCRIITPTKKITWKKLQSVQHDAKTTQLNIEQEKEHLTSKKKKKEAHNYMLYSSVHIADCPANFECINIKLEKISGGGNRDQKKRKMVKVRRYLRAPLGAGVHYIRNTDSAPTEKK